MLYMHNAPQAHCCSPTSDMLVNTLSHDTGFPTHPVVGARVAEVVSQVSQGTLAGGLGLCGGHSNSSSSSSRCEILNMWACIKAGVDEHTGN
jgi:hypothetical protein